MKQKIYNYTAIFEPDLEVGGYVVRVPTLPGCITQGETLDEAQAMAKDAISLYLEVLRDRGEEIPIEPQGRVIIDIPVQLA